MSQAARTLSFAYDIASTIDRTNGSGYLRIGRAQKHRIVCTNQSAPNRHGHKANPTDGYLQGGVQGGMQPGDG